MKYIALLVVLAFSFNVNAADLQVCKNGGKTLYKKNNPEGKVSYFEAVRFNLKVTSSNNRSAPAEIPECTAQAKADYIKYKNAK